MRTQQKLRYICTEQWLLDDYGNTRKAWRLNVLDADGGVLCAVNDVCGSESQARQLEAYFTRNQISPRHVLNVLDDLLS